jgi:hypothetical protein
VARRILIDLAGGFVEPLATGPRVVERAGPPGAPWPAKLRDRVLEDGEVPEVVNLHALGRAHGGDVIVEVLGAQTVIEGGGPLARIEASAATIDQLVTLFGDEVELLAPGTVIAATGPSGLVVTGIGDRSEGKEIVGAAIADLALQVASAVAGRDGTVAMVGLGPWLAPCAGLVASLHGQPMIVIDCMSGTARSVAPLGRQRVIRTYQGDWQRLRERTRRSLTPSG